MADNPMGALICGVFLVVVFNFSMWFMFAKDLNYYKEQHPGMCQDGREMGQQMNETLIGVDDTKRNKGIVYMKCSFAVAVYHCNDAGIEADDWDGQCRSLALAPAFPSDLWPRRQEDIDGLECCERSCLGGDQCSAIAWDCAHGKCSAYQKAALTCAGRARQAPYKCFSLKEGDATAEVREDASKFPAGWLVGGIIAILLACGCCFFAFVVASEEDDFLLNLGATCCCGSIVIGIAWLIIFLIRALQGDADNKGLVESVYGDLAKVGGLNGTTVAHEKPPPEGMHWALVLAIVLGSLLGVFCVGLAGIACAAVCCRKDDSKAAVNEEEMSLYDNES